MQMLGQMVELEYDGMWNRSGFADSIENNQLYLPSPRCLPEFVNIPLGLIRHHPTSTANASTILDDVGPTCWTHFPGLY